ncbi:MAG: isochorismatase family cysteine hydrolase [Candidatus Paceibacterota bacterium]|jgi:nicotinamidase-related amidase
MGKEKKLLIIIDVQNFFINKYTKEIPQRIADFLKKNGSKYYFIAFTKYLNDKKSPFYKKLKFRECLGGEQVKIAQELKEFVSKDNLFTKSTYSAFQNKSLTSFIKKHKINKIEICGLTSDGCVLATAFEGFDLGFDIKVLKDLTGTCWGPEEFNQSCLNLIGYKIDPSLLKLDK